MKNLQTLIEPAVTGLGYEYVGFELEQGPNSSVLRVFIDSENGIDVDACAAVSRQISAILDVDEPLSGRYHLEVSSPGLNRPLFAIEHYRKVEGQKVRLRLRSPRDNRRKFVGILTAVKGDEVTLDVEGHGEMTFHFSEIDKANVIAEL